MRTYHESFRSKTIFVSHSFLENLTKKYSVCLLWLNTFQEKNTESEFFLDAMCNVKVLFKSFKFTIARITQK